MGAHVAFIIRQTLLLVKKGLFQSFGFHAIAVGACLDPKFSLKFYYAKRRFPITLKCRQMHGVLNIDEIKN
jgi:hypothetical protein